MLTLDSSLRIPSRVAFTFVDGDAVLLDMSANKYFALEEVGARLWTLLKDGRNLKEAHQALLAKYDVASAELEQDLLELVGQLLESALVELVEA